jgi:hypothetical protein
MTLKLSGTLPVVLAETLDGEIHCHRWAAKTWIGLSSHPKQLWMPKVHPAYELRPHSMSWLGRIAVRSRSVFSLFRGHGPHPPASRTLDGTTVRMTWDDTAMRSESAFITGSRHQGRFIT